MDGKAQYDKAPPRAQLFIDYHVGGMSQTDAYKKAGYTGKSSVAPGQQAHKYRQAIAYRQAEVRDDTERARQDSVDRLTRYAKGSLAKVVSRATMTLTPAEWAALDPEDAALISEMTIDYDDGGAAVRVKVKIEPRKACEDSLAKLQGWNKPTEHKIKGEGLLSEDGAAKLAAAFKAIE